MLITYKLNFFAWFLQLEVCAVHLWNWAATKNVGAAISNIQKAKGTLLVALYI